MTIQQKLCFFVHATKKAIANLYLYRQWKWWLRMEKVVLMMVFVVGGRAQNRAKGKSKRNNPADWRSSVLFVGSTMFAFCNDTLMEQLLSLDF